MNTLLKRFSKNRCLIAGMVIFIMLLSGCGRKDSGTKEPQPFSDFISSMDKEISFSDMSAGESGTDGMYSFSFDGDTTVELLYNLSEAGKIVIDGAEYELGATVELTSGTTPQIALHDINLDGKMDVIINWTLYRGFKSIVYISQEDGYISMPSVTDYGVRYTDYKAEYEDNYKISIKAEKLDINCTRSLGKEFIEYDKENPDGIYTVKGKVKSQCADKQMVADADVDVRYFVKSDEVYVCHRAQFRDGAVWSAVSLNVVYKIEGNEYIFCGLYPEEEYISFGW